MLFQTRKILFFRIFQFFPLLLFVLLTNVSCNEVGADQGSIGSSNGSNSTGYTEPSGGLAGGPIIRCGSPGVISCNFRITVNSELMNGIAYENGIVSARGQLYAVTENGEVPVTSYDPSVLTSSFTITPVVARAGCTYDVLDTQRGEDNGRIVTYFEAARISCPNTVLRTAIDFSHDFSVVKSTETQRSTGSQRLVTRNVCRPIDCNLPYSAAPVTIVVTNTAISMLADTTQTYEELAANVPRVSPLLALSGKTNQEIEAYFELTDSNGNPISNNVISSTYHPDDPGNGLVLQWANPFQLGDFKFRVVGTWLDEDWIQRDAFDDPQTITHIYADWMRSILP